MSEAGINKFFAIARERYRILEKRRMGLPKPWSNEPIFQREYFCNVFREDDKVTTWFRENIRDPLNSAYALSPKVILLAIVAFRWFNKIETWDSIISSGVSVEDIFSKWDTEWIRGEIADHCKPPYVTGAYIIKTPDGMNKVEGVLWCIDEFKKQMDMGQFDKILTGKCTMEEACDLLKRAPFLGNFMSYQVVSDARFTCLLENASDIMTWAQPGPGCARGLGRTFFNNVDQFSNSSSRDVRDMLKLMSTVLEFSKDPNLWPEEWPKWEMSTIQHWSCEVDKYYRAEEGGKMKRKYG